MASIYFAVEVLADFERILDHLMQYGSEDGAERFTGIRAALDVLSTNPLIGRPAGRGYRELVIGRGMRGYIALYNYAEETDTVRIVAIRSQKEAGYQRP